MAPNKNGLMYIRPGTATIQLESKELILDFHYIFNKYLKYLILFIADHDKI